MTSMSSIDCGQYRVSDYHFVDENGDFVSFLRLPVEWNNCESQGGEQVNIYLHGTCDQLLPEIRKRVIAWKFDILSEIPQLFVQSEDNSWIKLGKPKKSFEDTVRSLLITLHCIHYVTRNPETSGDSVWNHLSGVFRLNDVRSSQSNLVDHIPLISDCVNRYPGLEDSEFLAALLKEKTMKRKLSGDDTEARKKLKIIIENINDNKIDDAEDEDKDNLFGEVCTLCDDGGKIICCEGGCLRSFHATEEAGAGSYCKSLGFMPDDIVGMQNFYCKNCEYKQHQCFICGKLGSSDKSSGSAEVVSCVSPGCGRFYHPCCVAKLLNKDIGVPAKEIERKIAGGETFTCPIHKCCICGKGENKKDKEFQFAVCMRCPKSYHRKCMPREIAFENQSEPPECRSITRAWDGLLANRILVYCINHDIDMEIGTARRDHIKFPDAKQNMSTLKSKSILEEQWKPISKFLGEGDNFVSNRNTSVGKSRKGKTAATVKKPNLQKKSKKLMPKQKGEPKSNFWPEESDEQTVLSEVLKQKLSSLNEKKTNLKGKLITEEKGGQTTTMVSVFRSNSRMVKQKNLLKQEHQTPVCEKLKTSLGEKPFSAMDPKQVKFRNQDTPDANLVSHKHNELRSRTEWGDHGSQNLNPSKSYIANGQVHFSIPDEVGRECSGRIDEGKRENSHINGTKEQDSQFSEGSYPAGHDSVYYHIMAFSSSFYSHIVCSSSTINRLPMTSNPTASHMEVCKGFAPGPQLKYSLQNSAGWINAE